MSDTDTRRGDMIREAREARKLTVEKLAEMAAIPASTLREWESGRLPMSLRRASRLESVLDLGRGSLSS